MTDVIAILVNYKSLDNIRARLSSEALRHQRAVVVDNSDDPDGVRALCHEHGNATPLLLDRNYGFAAAVNRAVAEIGHTKTPILVLNPDAELTLDALVRLRERLQAGPDGVGPLLVETHLNRIQIGSGGGPLSLRSVVYYFLFFSHLLPWLKGVFLTRRQLEKATRVNWLCMACLLLTGDAFERFGPIPEDELVYAEDIAWGTLASGQGAVFEQLPNVVVLHESGASGARHKWIGALERLCRRRLGVSRGMLAIAVIRMGLLVRRLLGRNVV